MPHFIISCLLFALSVSALRLWPLPEKFTLQSNPVSLDANNFKWTYQGPLSPDVTDALIRFAKQTFPRYSPKPSPGSLLREIIISVKDVAVPLQLGVDESYTLNVIFDPSVPTASLVAPTYWGFLRGMETFSQLVTYDYTLRSYSIANASWHIEDAPRFAHRGMLIDTSRHWLAPVTIKKLIDSLTYAKLNTLHWHAVDSQSCPIESRLFPRWWLGSYSEFERYTQEDIKDIVAYARARGVRVVFELDEPHHAASWCTGYPSICPSPVCQQPLDVSNPDTFAFLRGVIGEFLSGPARLSLDTYFHLGADEVNTACWENTPHVREWMTARNMTPVDAYLYFINQAASFVRDNKATPIMWDEVFSYFGAKSPAGTVIHIWKRGELLLKAVAAGFRVIASNVNPYYLDQLAITWKQVYTFDPVQNVTDPGQLKLVLGAEMEMWGETADGSDLFATVWPKLAAGAERWWRSAKDPDVNDAHQRLSWFRCLMLSRGIGAAPLENAQARTAPPKPGSCFAQQVK